MVYVWGQEDSALFKFTFIRRFVYSGILKQLQKAKKKMVFKGRQHIIFIFSCPRAFLYRHIYRQVMYKCVIKCGINVWTNYVWLVHSARKTGGLWPPKFRTGNQKCTASCPAGYHILELLFTVRTTKNFSGQLFSVTWLPATKKIFVFRALLVICY